MNIFRSKDSNNVPLQSPSALNEAKREMEKIKMDLELEKGQIIRDNQAKDHTISLLEKQVAELKEKMQDHDKTQDYLRNIIQKREAEKK